ncbi:hypothetical protein P3T33_004740 [Rhizobium sp. AN67]|nr:hypothetical protein [Rhizobium sp. AN67]SOD50555.1 hypothetical protein SAMN05216595_0232 [Rhizobium sp. AN6A]
MTPKKHAGSVAHWNKPDASARVRTTTRFGLVHAGIVAERYADNCRLSLYLFAKACSLQVGLAGYTLRGGGFR